MPPLSTASVVTALRAAGCVFAEEEAELILTTARTPDDVTAMVDRRVSGVPLEVVLGWAEFAGLRIAVDPGVFVPRRRTEFLVERALAAVPHASVVVDLCCGSGALGAALAASLDGAELHAADIDPAAVRCARRNIAPYGGHAHEGDLFTALPAGLRGRVDILAANVPYVPTGDVPLLPGEARDHEPLVALDGGADGLDVLRRVAAEAPRWLAPGGCLLVETSERQEAHAVEVLRGAGLIAGTAVSEERAAHVVTGTRPTGR
ncbi:putative protein N(5)-glutamine methyltransferase [Streptomyces sp. NPDC008159]|uniref:putative protein N(5)-glutamine methyltransferase n=1 Tax=Streptomyces sp. NPDC008159 TaxID=3364817 RepID=UPI0036F13FA8